MIEDMISEKFAATVDWNEFCHVITLIAFFIIILSCLLYVASYISSGADDHFLLGADVFGIVLFGEATIANMFKLE